MNIHMSPKNETIYEIMEGGENAGSFSVDTEGEIEVHAPAYIASLVACAEENLLKEKEAFIKDGTYEAALLAVLRQMGVQITIR